MPRKRKPKSDKIKTVLIPDEIKTVSNNAVTKFNIEFVPIIINAETGRFQNLNLFQELLPILEETSHIFGDDSIPKVENYHEWLQYHIGFVQNAAPWIFAVLVDGKPQGFCWAINWAGNGPGVHSVQISGANRRKTPVAVTTQTIKMLVDLIFQQTEVYIIRGGYTQDNRAAGLALGRAGFSHPETERATMTRSGQEITGIIKSLTRPEWEVLKHG